MTTVQRVAQIFGWGLLIVGVIGFIYSISSTEADPNMAPHIFGLFPTNLWHNIFHAVTGIWGIAASRSWDSSRTFCRVLGVIYIILVPLGFITPDFFGIMPIGGNDIWLHAIIGIPLAYFGFSARTPSPTRTTTPTP